eukprot:CAMPEP_0114671148 /NCGR_PEP_ID=MMETSP0191-20121206/40669_1 /TAXON_ID=126664 /ORGANISM="Sorites sp." /LENGTH=163 /DNA_ID=CAMNT_0001930303 /DNA_START=338 /DNA_END=829 /DNA_ORIENTATION=-
METLHGQRKQLQNIDKMLHETDQTLKQTKHTLNGMESIYGGLKNWLFKKPPKVEAYKGTNINNNNNNNDTGGNIKVHKRKNAKKNNPFDNYVQSSDVKNNNEDQEHNEQLDQILKSVNRLNVMAKEMNNELANQDELLDSIDDRMGNVDHRLQNQSRQMNRIH